MKLDRFRPDEGFTLIEVLASILVFAIMTLGLVPLLAGSIRGSDQSRGFTQKKNIIAQAMERTRGLPYFISYGAQAKKVDVLDLYFPGLVGTAPVQNYNGAGTFTTTCTPATTGHASCPKDIPPGTTVRFTAKFVNGDNTTVVPAAGYTWNATDGKDLPPSQLLSLVIEGTWDAPGSVGARSFKLETLMGDRKFGGLKVTGSARIDHGIQIQTYYVEPAFPNRKSLLIARAGTAESKINTRLVSAADQSVTAVDLRLVEVPPDGSLGVDLASFTGASASLHAPPDATPADVGPLTGTTLTHSHNILDGISNLQVAGVDRTLVTNQSVKVQNELPTATGRFSFSPGVATLDFWVDNQADTTNTAQLHLDGNQKVIFLKGKTLSGDTSGVTTPLSDPLARKVETAARTSFSKLRLLPTTFIPSNAPGAGTDHERAVIDIQDFSASVSCKSTGSTGTATATAQWSARFFYWEDPQGIAGGSYKEIVIGTSQPNNLAALRTANPLVYDALLPTDDVYLFEDPNSLKNGYFESATALLNPLRTTTAPLASADLPGALTLNTAPTNPLLPESGLQVSIGKLSCDAEDRR